MRNDDYRARGALIDFILTIVIGLCGSFLVAILAFRPDPAHPAPGLIYLPPAEFDRPFDGELFVIERDAVDVDRTCREMGNRNALPALACAFPLISRCTIVLPRAVDLGWPSKPQQDRLRRHEIGHCNGWGSRHDGARLH